MKKLYFFFVCQLFISLAQSQLLTISSGTDLTIVNGTIFRIDSLTLTPTADFTLSNNTLSKSTTVAVAHATSVPYIARVYQFAGNTNSFTGTVQIDYTDGAELNGIPENELTLNVHNGSSWAAFPATTRDASNNFVLTNNVPSVLNELTLARTSAPLPLTWLSFTATKQNQTALLQWATAREQNTRNFTVQHSANGINWVNIGLQAAKGSSTSSNQYSYEHSKPITGINYYRILQTDMDNRSSYSAIKPLKFTKIAEPFTIMGNPVTNNMLAVQVNAPINLALYTAEGKLLWQQQVNAGTKTIAVSRYAKGTYLLKSTTTSQKVVIQ